MLGDIQGGIGGMGFGADIAAPGANGFSADSALGDITSGFKNGGQAQQ